MTKKKQRILVEMLALKAPASRDALMSAVGGFVSSRAMVGLVNEGYAVQHVDVVPTLWTLTPAGEAKAKELAA